jgi:pimeloyl-ACP methyl ester carboxylesterase
VQGRVSETLFRDRTTAAAWRSRSAWYAVSRRDLTISPELQRFMAGRMDATTVEIDSGHLSLVTHPEEVTALIMNAVQAVRSSATADATAQPI